MKWFAKAPSNIALIKYMGKIDHAKNIPSNSSLSYTLHHLQSTVEIENHNEDQDCWEPLKHDNSFPLLLNEKAQQRFLKHFNYLKTTYNITDHFIVRSNNNFPAGCGIASSASSFAALTQCAIKAFSDLLEKPLPDTQSIAAHARQGSGSSIRSFYSPWALWENEYANKIELPYKKLIHQIIMIENKHKKVASSLAHQHIMTSKRFIGRPQRATTRLDFLINALREKNWSDAFTIVWEEFNDMHLLFKTSSNPFNYITPQSSAALDHLKEYWETHADGPLITMDAGPNIHLLYRDDQQDIALSIKKELQRKNYEIL